MDFNLLEDNSEISSPNASSIYQDEILIFFNKPSYNSSVTDHFEYYGGIIKQEWNGLFTSVSGFAGYIPSELNKTGFQNEFPDALIENDEILEAQMNFASVQSGGINSTWYANGFKGDTNSSIAVLDTGINPNHQFFPNGYNSSDLSGDIVGWENFIDTNPIHDDNGHGTLISSVISGTGKDPYNSSNPTIISIQENYSHIDIFDEYAASKNYTIKICSFNASTLNSDIIINSSWNLEVEGIDEFWVELYHEDTLINYSHHEIAVTNYMINHTLTKDNLGIYDLYVKYHKQLQSKPRFSFNATISYFPEAYTMNYTHFTGVANATKIVAYKILDKSGIGRTSNLISSLYSVIHNRSKYHIISVCLSIGTLGEDVELINRVINEVIENNILVVIAAGNTGIEFSDSLNKLAQNKNAIVVGAINDKDQITSYSSMGKEIENVTKPDIVAPGGSKLPGHRSILSADSKSNESTSAYGTSISTAIVSAAINMLIEAKWDDWTHWNNINLTTWVRNIKSILLLTASETNTEREDDPYTIADESNYSPPLSFSPLTSGIKDIHEGYGRINIQAAIDALTKGIKVNTTSNGTLTSSLENPLGTHVFARQINLTENVHHLFNLSLKDTDADFDMLLFSNESNRYGEPILLAASRRIYGDFNYFYFTPKNNQTNCIITIKAIEGSGIFELNISTIENEFTPELKVPEINYVGGSRNTTIMSLQEFTGFDPQKNYSIDNYMFFIDYYDNDSIIPPQEVYVSILGLGNYTLTQLFPQDVNYTDGALFTSEFIQFTTPGIFQYFIIGCDGKFQTNYPQGGFLNITIEFPTDSIQFPNHHNFNEGIGNWTITGTGWDILHQDNVNDNRSRIYDNYWKSLYFGTYHDYPKNYTYQPIALAEDPFPNGSLISPLFNLTDIDESSTQPVVKFGLRVSINTGDFIYFQINLNWTGWTILRTFSDEEDEWILEEINLTQYIGNFIQFRFETALDDTFDPVNYKGLMLDYFAIENHTNSNSPLIYFNIVDYLSSTQGSKFQQFTFSCEYYDLDNNYPEFIYLEIDANNYTMYNIYGDWNASSTNSQDKGILFIKSLLLEEFSNQSFRFHVSDGIHINTTQWYNKNNSLFEFINPNPLQFKEFKDNTFIGYNFSSSELSDYYVYGSPIPKESTSWFRGDNTWHSITRLGKDYLFGGIGQSFGGFEQGYGVNWDIKLITQPLFLKGEHDVYLEYDYDISLQNEFFLAEDQLDRCNVSISRDFGKTWILLKEYTYDDEDLSGRERFNLNEYQDDEIMIMFTLHSNENMIGLAYGWLLSNIYLGYDKATDFIPPEIIFISPEADTTVKSTIIIKALISDNVDLDESRINILLNNRSVNKNEFLFNSTTNIIEFNWDTTQNHDGTYEIRVIAYDREGNKSEKLIVTRVNNLKWWQKWGPFLIIIFGAIIAGIALFVISEKRGRIWFKKIRNTRAEKVRLRDIDKDQLIKKIELIEHDEELKKPLTLHCKACKAWFTSSKFDIICPLCEHDQIYASYSCQSCGKWFHFDDPGENYYCKTKNCEGVKLVRRNKEEILDLLTKEGIVLRKFKIKENKFSILDD